MLQSNLYIVSDVVNTVVRSVQNICVILWIALLLYISFVLSACQVIGKLYSCIAAVVKNWVFLDEQLHVTAFTGHLT